MTPPDPYQMANMAGNLPGGLPTQLLFNHSVSSLRNQGLISGDAFYVGNQSVMSAIENQQLAMRQQQLLQMAAIDTAQGMTGTMANMSAWAGRPVTPDMYQGMLGANTMLSQLAVPFMAMMPQGLDLLDYAAGGVSSVPLSLAMSNMGMRMPDPVTGYSSLSIPASGYMATEMAAYMRQPVVEGGSMTRARGFTGRQLGSLMSHMQFRGQIPSSALPYRIMQADGIAEAMAAGTLDRSHFADIGRSETLADRFQRGRDPLLDEMNQSSSAGQLMYDQFSDSPTTAAMRNRIQLERDVAAEATLLSRDTDIANRTAGDNFKKFLHTRTTEAGAPMGMGGSLWEATKFGYRSAMRVPGAAQDLVSGDIDGLASTLVDIKDDAVASAAATRGSRSYREFDVGGNEDTPDALRKLGSDEVNRRMLLAMAASDPGMASRSAEANKLAGDMHVALKALHAGNMDEYNATQWSRMSFGERLAQYSLVTGTADTNRAVQNIAELSADDIYGQSAMNDDYFGVASAQGRSDAVLNGRTKEQYQVMATQMKKALEERTAQMAAVRELLGDEGIDADMEELLETLDQVTNNKSHQLTAADIEQGMLNLRLFKEQAGLSNEAVRALSSVSAQVAAQFGMRGAVEMSITEIGSSSLASYQQSGLGAMNVYGMKSAEQLAMQDQQIVGGAIASRQGNLVGTLIRLSGDKSTSFADTADGRRLEEISQAMQSGTMTREQRAWLAERMRNGSLSQIIGDNVLNSNRTSIGTSTVNRMAGEVLANEEVLKDPETAREMHNVARAARLSALTDPMTRAAQQVIRDKGITNETISGNITGNVLTNMMKDEHSSALFEGKFTDEAMARMDAAFVEQLRNRRKNASSAEQAAIDQMMNLRPEERQSILLNTLNQTSAVEGRPIQEIVATSNEYQQEISGTQGEYAKYHAMLQSRLSTMDKNAIANLNKKIQDGEITSITQILGKAYGIDLEGEQLAEMQRYLGEAGTDDTSPEELKRRQRRVLNDLRQMIHQEATGDPEKDAALSANAETTNPLTTGEARKEDFENFLAAFKEAAGDMRIVFSNATIEINGRIVQDGDVSVNGGGRESVNDVSAGN